MKNFKINKVPVYILAGLVAISLILLFSCETEPYNRYGFDSTFRHSSTGLTMMSINSHTSSIRLSGNIFMDAGEMKLEFIDPKGDVVYFRSFFARGNYVVNETFKASRGIWKLRYTSLEGRGSIEVHASYH
jgi:hypothetical protein